MKSYCQNNSIHYREKVAPINTTILISIYRILLFRAIRGIHKKNGPPSWANRISYWRRVMKKLIKERLYIRS